jgi:hypothetical protein
MFIILSLAIIIRVDFPQHGTTGKMKMGQPMCTPDDYPITHSALNRTDLLHRRLKHFYKGNTVNEMFPNDFATDEEEVESFKFIYEDSVPESLLEDDEVRSLWRWSRNIVTHASMIPPYTVIAEKDFDMVLKSHRFGAVVFGLSCKFEKYLPMFLLL